MAPHIIWEPNYVDVTASEAMQAVAENGHNFVGRISVDRRRVGERWMAA